LEEPSFPQSEQWEQWVVTHHDQDAVSSKIQNTSELKRLGAEVLVLSADPTDAGQVRSAMLESVAHFGTLHGVIHAAGVTGEKSFRAIQETGPSECRWHFEPKVYGLLALEEAVRDRDLDFCLLVSSLAYFLGGLGYAAYAGSNWFMDAFAQNHNRSQPVPWISVDWDAWQLEGSKLTAIVAELAQFAMTPDEVAEVFRRIVTLVPADQVVVSTSELSVRLQKWIKKFDAMRNVAQADGTESASILHPRPNLQNSYVAPRNDLERAMVAVWQRVLGFEQLGVQDNFFELGGDSFIAIRAISHMRQELNREISVVSLYEAPTVETLVKSLEQESAAELVQVEEQEAKLNRRKQYRQKKLSKRQDREDNAYE